MIILTIRKKFWILLIAFLLGVLCGQCKGNEWTDEEIATAIWWSEGGEKASKPYGILSVPCDSKDSCKVICLNTIRNNRKRYTDYGHKEYDTYLEFLWHRYAPPEVHHLNKYWLKNVLFFLRKYNQ